MSADKQSTPEGLVARMIAAALREVPDRRGYEGWSFQTQDRYITQPSDLAEAFEAGDMPQRCVSAALAVLRKEMANVQ